MKAKQTNISSATVFEVLVISAIIENSYLFISYTIILYYYNCITFLHSI